MRNAHATKVCAYVERNAKWCMPAHSVRLNPYRLRAITIIGKVSNKTNNHTKINWRDAPRHMTMFYFECSSTQFAPFFVVEQWRPASVTCTAVVHAYTISIFVHCWTISNSLEYLCSWFNGVVGLRTHLQSPDENKNIEENDEENEEFMLKWQHSNCNLCDRLWLAMDTVHTTYIHICKLLESMNFNHRVHAIAEHMALIIITYFQLGMSAFWARYISIVWVDGRLRIHRALELRCMHAISILSLMTHAPMLCA